MRIILKSVTRLTFLVFLFFISIPFSVTAAEVDIYAEAMYSAQKVNLYIYANINTTELISFGLKVIYSEDTTPVSSGVNDKIWYLGGMSSKYPYLEPDMETEGEIIITGYMLDTSSPNQGVSGQDVLLGVIQFDRTSPIAPFFFIYPVGEGDFDNFVSVSGVVLDDQPDGVYFSSLSIVGDIDGDSLPDDVEDSSCTDENDADSDDDGLSDGEEDVNHNGIVDSGETDPCNDDTDGDGIQDGTELGITVGIPDPDDAGPLLGTNMSFFIPDADSNTFTDPLDDDTDNDGLLDGEEDTNYNGRVDEGETDPTTTEATAVPYIGFTGMIVLFLILLLTGYIKGRKNPFNLKKITGTSGE